MYRSVSYAFPPMAWAVSSLMYPSRAVVSSDSPSILLTSYTSCVICGKNPFWRASRGSSTGSSSEVGRSSFGTASNARQEKSWWASSINQIPAHPLRRWYYHGSTRARMHNPHWEHSTASCSSPSKNARPCCMCGSHAACWPWIASTTSSLEWGDLYQAASTQTENICYIRRM